MSNSIGMIIESLVAILLMLTICYCMLLNRRLKLLKADEQALRATIGELVTATEIAERAIAGLKVAAHECDAGLGERLGRAERVCAELDLKLAAGRGVVERVAQIISAARRGAAPSTAPIATAPIVAAGAVAPAAPQPKDAQSIAIAAQAFAERLRTKVYGLAA